MTPTWTRLILRYLQQHCRWPTAGRSIENFAFFVGFVSVWSVWLGYDTIWWHRSGSILLMTWYLAAPSHYLNQYWIIINGTRWPLDEGNFTVNMLDISHYRVFDNYIHIWNNCYIPRGRWVNSLRPRRNGRYNADDIFRCLFVKENVCIPTKISLKFVPKGPINNLPALVQIMAWRRPGDKPLTEPMMSPGRRQAINWTNDG